MHFEAWLAACLVSQPALEATPKPSKMAGTVIWWKMRIADASADRILKLLRNPMEAARMGAVGREMSRGSSRRKS